MRILPESPIPCRLALASLLLRDARPSSAPRIELALILIGALTVLAHGRRPLNSFMDQLLLKGQPTWIFCAASAWLWLDQIHGASSDGVMDALCDPGCVIADSLDVLRAKQQVRAGRDVARIFHHLYQEIAKDRVLHRVEFGIAEPDYFCAHRVAPRVCVENVDQHVAGQIAHLSKTDCRVGRSHLGFEQGRTPRNVLREIADAFEVSGNTHGPEDLAQISGDGLAARDRQNRLILDLALQLVEARIALEDGLRQSAIAVRQGI